MAGAVDFKKQNKELYMPPTTPGLVEVPTMRFLMVDGHGDPNTSQAYHAAVDALYALSYTIKMSKMGSQLSPGYFDFVVPPLEGLWWSLEENVDWTAGGYDKSKFTWTSMIRQPDFVNPEVLEQSKFIAAKKKPEVDTGLVRLEEYAEGLCVQIMHIGPYDDEPATIQRMDAFVYQQGYVMDFSPSRGHHEIYLGDPRKTAPEKLKTVIRHPVRPGV
ncbi:MAG: transcriptional regulator [Clostridiales bacterium]|nr:transcriptional regulator [Clostridiales bacterium]